MIIYNDATSATPIFALSLRREVQTGRGDRSYHLNDCELRPSSGMRFMGRASHHDVGLQTVTVNRPNASGAHLPRLLNYPTKGARRAIPNYPRASMSIRMRPPRRAAASSNDIATRGTTGFAAIPLNPDRLEFELDETNGSAPSLGAVTRLFLEVGVGGSPM
jgi:hypothetical protein